MNHYEELQKLARDIARGLGPDWRLSTKDGGWQCFIEGRDGMRLYVSPKDSCWFDPEGMITVSGDYPRGQHGIYGRRYGQKMPKIGVSVRRGVEAIVQDIQRRFLPHYVERYREAMEVKRQHDRAQDQAQAAAEELATILRQPVRSGNGGGTPVIHLPLQGNGYCAFHLQPGGTVRISHASIPLHVAKAMAQAVMELQGQEEA